MKPNEQSVLETDGVVEIDDAKIAYTLYRTDAAHPVLVRPEGTSTVKAMTPEHEVLRFTQHFQYLVWDHRGTGESSGPVPGPEDLHRFPTASPD